MTSPVNDFSRLPQELKQRNQWCIAGTDKSPYVKSGDGLRRASVHENILHTFEDAVSLAAQYNTNFGFILNAADPFCCIDLDVKDSESRSKDGKPLDPSLWTTQAELDGFRATLLQFATYAEVSKSGKGLHLWLYGNIGKGARRESVEIYSQERFIIFTGNSCNDVRFDINSNSVVSCNILNPNPYPLSNNSENLLSQAVEQMRTAETIQESLIEVESEYTNREIHEIAQAADNGAKYDALCSGDWEGMGYESQSEADLALMSIYTFYSNSNEQCRQIFRCTELGKRDKAVKDNRYLDKTLQLIRGRQERQNQLAEAGKAQAEKLFANLQTPPEPPPAPTVAHEPNVAAMVAQMQTASATQATAAPLAAQAAQLPEITDNGLPWPPGLAGAIAGFIYQNSQHPVREVSIVGALGLLAGMCGKAFTLPGTGLNLYIVLVAGSGVGKEAMHQGVQVLVRSVSQLAPTITQFVDFSKPVSGPALTKLVAGNPSFCNIIGEFGRRMRQMASDDGREGPMQQLRTVMTDLYSKSGPGAVVGGLRYSNKDNDVQSVSGVAYSMIGETTPDTYYESLSGSMMEDGFLSRFTTIEYHGERPEHSYHIISEPDENLRQALAGLATQASTLIGRFQTQEVAMDAEAAGLSNDFRSHCTRMINYHKGENEIIQMWNRAHLKVIRIAGLLAAADNYVHPTITPAYLKWALTVVTKDIANGAAHFEKGEVGDSDATRRVAILNILKSYLEKQPAKSYRIDEKMRAEGIIPKRYLNQRAERMSCFYKHRLGSGLTLKHVLADLEEQGYVIEIPSITALSEYNSHQSLYRILEL